MQWVWPCNYYGNSHFGDILPLACKTCESIFLRKLKFIFEVVLCEFASLLQLN